jgi:hypothetical protein
MRKTLLALALALAGLSALPAVSSANLTAGGAEIPVGTKIVGKSPINQFTTGGYCGGSEITGEVLTNGPNPVVAITSSRFYGPEGEYCVSPFGKDAVSLQANRICHVIKSDRWFLTNTPTGSCAFSDNHTNGFTKVFPGWGTCRYSGAWFFNSGGSEQLRTNTENTSWSQIEGGGFCGSAKLEVVYEFTTPSGQLVRWNAS